MADAYKILTLQGSTLPNQYKGLVTARWLRTLKYGSDLFKLVDPKSYWAKYPSYVEALLQRPGTQVLIAVLADDPDVALGYAVLEGEILHYLHVQKDLRRQGIGSALVSKALVSSAGRIAKISHLTRQGLSFWSARLPTAKFDPFA